MATKIAAAKQKQQLAERMKLTPEQRLDLSSKEWTDKQRKFVHYYRQYLNASRAAKDAGYNVTIETAGVIGCQVLQIPHVAAFIQTWREETAKRYEVTADRVIAEVTKIAYGNVSRFQKIDERGNVNYDFTGATDDDMAAISELTVDTYIEKTGPNAEDFETVKQVKVKTHSRLQALELLGKLNKLQLFKDRVEVTGDLAATILDRRKQIRAMRDKRAVEQAPSEKRSDRDDAARLPAAAPSRDIRPQASASSNKDKRAAALRNAVAKG